MSQDTHSVSREQRPGPLEWFFGTWRFAAFGLSLLFFFTLMVVSILLIPGSGKGSLSSFANEFRTWCFGYDPATGKMDWSYVLTFVTSAVMLAGMLSLIWGRPLRQAWREQRRAVLPFIGGAALLVASLGGGFAALYKTPVRGELPFPADRLRTNYKTPALVLTNQNRQRISLKSFRGKVVLITAVYSSCGYTCPMIFAQMKRAFSKLTPQQRSGLRVLAITLDPKRDRPVMLARASKAHKLSAPFFHFLTGGEKEVNQALDRFGFARTRDSKTGKINHVNLFLLVDAKGRLAYRFSLGERQERWLIQALRLLSREARKTKSEA